MAYQRVTFAVTAYATATTDITADVLTPHFAEWGFGDNAAESRIATSGSCDLYLDNYGSVGRYLPGHSNCLAGWGKGTPIEVSFTYDGTTKTHRYYVGDCQVDGTLEERIHVLAYDWLDYASNTSVDNPALLEESTVDVGISTIIADVPLAPQSTDLDVGTLTLPTIFDTTTRYTKVYSELSKMAYSELGHVYLKKPEQLVFDNLTHRNGSLALRQIPTPSSSAGYLLATTGNRLTTATAANPILFNAAEDVSISIAGHDILSYTNENGNNVINRFVSSSHPREVDADSILLYEPERVTYLSSGETITFRGYYTDPTSQRLINAVPPTEQNYIKSLLKFIGTEGYIRSLDDETGRVWTLVDASLATDIFGDSPKFYNTSLYLDGTNSYIYSQASEAWNVGGGDFMVDWWEWRFDTTSGKLTVSSDGTVAFPGFRLARSDGANLRVDFSSNGSSFDIASNKTLGTISTGDWVHLQVGRLGNNWATWKNGVIQDTWTSSATVYYNNTPLYIGKNQSTYNDMCMNEFRFIKGYCDPLVNFTPPTEPYQIEGTFYSAWSVEDGTGTELTASVDLSVAYGTAGSTFTLTNNSTTPAYVFQKTYGRGIHLSSPSENVEYDQGSINSHGFHEERLNQPYLQTNYVGKLEGQRLIEEEKDSRIVVNAVKMKANSSASSMSRFLNVDIGDLVTFDADGIEKDAHFFVQNIKYSMYAPGIIDYEWILREHYSLNKGLDDMAVEFRGGANTDALVFPYMPYVAGNEVTAFSISAWIYLDTNPTSNFYFIAGAYMDGAGTMLYLPQDATNRYAGVYSSKYSSSPGAWRTSANPFSLSTWTHIVMTLDLSSTSNDPLIYVNGASQTITETSTPAGTIMSSVGCPFFIGNVGTATYNYNKSFDGKIRDVRYFPSILSQSQVSEIYNGGTYSPTVGRSGQVLQAPAVRSKNYTGYTNLTLTSSDKMLDAHLCMVGTPNGSPIARTP